MERFLGGNMKIFIIGSSQYKDKMLDHAHKMEAEGHRVYFPALDDVMFNSTLEILQTNKKRMQGADEVHLFYDGRSQGTLIDFGMAIALDKPLRIIYINDKSIVDGMKEYAVTEVEDMNNKAWITKRYYQDFDDLDKSVVKTYPQ
jgi:nucleoside 2-deoxyribosyltransferase